MKWLLVGNLPESSYLYSMIKEVKNKIDRVENLMLELKAGFITEDQYYTELEKIGQTWSLNWNKEI